MICFGKMRRGYKEAVYIGAVCVCVSRLFYIKKLLRYKVFVVVVYV